VHVPAVSWSASPSVALETTRFAALMFAATLVGKVRLVHSDQPGGARECRSRTSWLLSRLHPWGQHRSFHRTGSHPRGQQARAHHGLAACQAAGDPGQARQHGQRALAIYTKLGVPEAARLPAQVPDPGLLQAASHADAPARSR